MVLFSGSCRFSSGPVGRIGLVLLAGCGKPEAVREDAAIAGPASVEASVVAAGSARSPILPPYDLEADVRERIDGARRELDAATAPVQVVGGVYVFVAADHGGPLFDEAVRVANRGLPLLLGSGHFDKPPDRAVTVYAYSSEDRYVDACKRRLGTKTCDTPYGRYVMDGRFIIANLSRGVHTCLHEMVHPIVQTDAPMAPAYLDEGIAALMEQPKFDPPGEIHGDTNWRLPDLQHHLESVRLEDLFAMSDAEFRSPKGLLLREAEARYLCKWLDDQGLLWPFYRGVRDAAAGDPHGATSFGRVVGEAPAEADRAWRTWVGGLHFRGQ